MIRSTPLLVLGLAMIASSGALATLLQHDGEVGLDRDVAAAEAGETVRLKGGLTPWTIPPHRAGAWTEIGRSLDNHTYQLDQDDASLLLLVTSGEPIVEPGTVVVEGTVLLAAPHPTDRNLRVVILGDPDVTSPLMFR